MANSEQRKFSDLLYVFYKWKKIIIVNMLIIVIVSTIISFLIPIDYKATTTLMIPPQNSMSLSNLSGIIAGGISSVGADLLGIKGGQEDVYFAILNSRTVLKKVIDKFKLIEYYKVKDNNYDKTIKVFQNDLAFRSTEFGLIEINVVNVDQKKAASIANYFTEILDSINISISLELAKNNRSFIEKRYLKNIQDLHNAENDMHRFQKEYGIYILPEQFEAIFKIDAEIETQLIQTELALGVVENEFGNKSPQYFKVKNQFDGLKNKVDELKGKEISLNNSNILVPFNKMPDIYLRYFKIYREVQIQSKIMEFILPMYEQARFEEKKNIPTIIILDKATPPQIKNSPNRIFIILSSTFISFFIIVLFITHFNSIVEFKEDRNPVQDWEYQFISRILLFYKVKV